MWNSKDNYSSKCTKITPNTKEVLKKRKDIIDQDLDQNPINMIEKKTKNTVVVLLLLHQIKDPR